MHTRVHLYTHTDTRVRTQLNAPHSIIFSHSPVHLITFREWLGPVGQGRRTTNTLIRGHCYKDDIEKSNSVDWDGEPCLLRSLAIWPAPVKHDDLENCKQSDMLNLMDQMAT